MGYVALAPIAVWMALVPACSRARTNEHDGRAAATPMAAAWEDSAAPSSVPPTLGQGIHDYRGTLGKNTRIAVHLVRTGDTVLGSYVYLAVGRAITLTGSVDSAGVVSLREGSPGTSTGSLRLRLDGLDLVGVWTNSPGDKQLPARVSPGPAWLASARDGGTSLTQRARECLADPMCPAEDAERAFVAAEEARDSDVFCGVFLEGAGTKRDLRRARACLERRRDAHQLSCEPGNSPGLEQADLAVMLIDGVAGKTDIPSARALFEGCLLDVTVTAVLEHADAKEADANVRPMHFCADDVGTTLVSNECIARERDTKIAQSDLAAKALAKTLDDAGQRLFVASVHTHSAYAEARARFAYEVSIEGSLRNAIATSSEDRLLDQRAKDLAGFASFRARDASAEDTARAEQRLTAALSTVTFQTPSEADFFKKEQAAWVAYRDAEVALYAHAFGPKQGEDRVRRTLLIRLAERRALTCAEGVGQ